MTVFIKSGAKCYHSKSLQLKMVRTGTHTYIALQTFVGVSLWGEAVVLVRDLGTPGLAGHAQNGDGGWTPVCISISSLTV